MFGFTQKEETRLRKIIKERFAEELSHYDALPSAREMAVNLILFDIAYKKDMDSFFTDKSPKNE